MDLPEDGPSFARILVSLDAGRRTGVLEVVAEDVTTLLYFLQGRVVFAEQGTLGETLGRVLLREGKLNQKQYAQVIDRMTAALVDSEQMRFGEAAVELGFLDPREVGEALSTQVRRKVLCCFQWDCLRLAFDPAEEALGEVAHFPSDVPPLVCEGIRRHWDLARATQVLRPHRTRYASLLHPASELTERLHLHPAESRMLRTVDGRRTLEDLLAASELDTVLAHQLAAALVVTGSVQMREAPEPAEPEPAEPPKARRPERAPERPARPAAKAAAQRLAAQLARRGLQRPPRSSAPPKDEKRARLEAEQAYQRGLGHMSYEAWHPAAKELRRAVKRCPDVIEYELLATWADFRATSPATEPELEQWRTRLEGLAARSLKADRENAFAWHVQGQLAAMRDDEPKALKYFRIAHRLDPTDREAERRVRLLTRRLEPERKKK